MPSLLIWPLFGFFGMSTLIAAEDLVAQYQKATDEIVKRDLAKKMFSAGVLKSKVTTTKEIARIFGNDWAVLKEDAAESFGIVHIAKQPAGKPDFQTPELGWYLFLYYDAKSQILIRWDDVTDQLIAMLTKEHRP